MVNIDLTFNNDELVKPINPTTVEQFEKNLPLYTLECVLYFKCSNKKRVFLNHLEDVFVSMCGLKSKQLHYGTCTKLDAKCDSLTFIEILMYCENLDGKITIEHLSSCSCMICIS